MKADLIPEKFMSVLADYLEDMRLAKMVNERVSKEWDKAISVDINEL